MAQKKQKLEDIVTLVAEALGVVSYADYFTQTPLFTNLRIENGGSEALADPDPDRLQRPRPSRLLRPADRGGAL